MEFKFKNSLSVGLLAGIVGLAACADDEDVSDLGQVDVAQLRTGTNVDIASNVGSVVVPMAVAIPSGLPEDDINSALASAISLTVTNDVSGVSASLSSGTLVYAQPSSASEYRWTINDDRDIVTFTFYNQTSTGESLDSAGSYTAVFSVASNDIVEAVASTSVPVTVTGG